MDNKTIFREVLGMIDLTSLNSTDTPSRIGAMVDKVNAFHGIFPDYPLPASICVFPNFASLVKSLNRTGEVHATVVGGCFPASQSPLEVKLLECSCAVRDGADEVDIVLALNSFLDGKANLASDEISQIGAALRGIKPDVVLKVILESGLLGDSGLIEDASFLAMEAGADFIKTSTGKTQPSATPEAVRTMCGCIGRYHASSGRKVGIKPAGGISTTEDAILYYNIVGDALGEGWLDKKYFRFGASRMANNLLSALEGREIKYF